MSCVKREIVLELDADEAWDAVLDMEAWLADEADVDLEPGGEGHFRLDDGSERRALVEEVDAGRTVSWWWWNDDDPHDLGTHVQVRLEDAIAGTRVIVVESGFAVGPVAMATKRLGCRIPALSSLR
jgi:Activator of Hsp90 ATPase homolog 1-like protein